MRDKEDAERTIFSDLVVTKYKMAADITNRTLKCILEKCVTGASVREICKFGDQMLRDETGKQFKKEKDLKKGVAFPTCISVNNCICHFSPLNSEPDYTLNEGDVTKIDLGAHIDGYIAVVAHTIVVGFDPKSGTKITGRKADVLLAAHHASEAALRLVKPGNESDKVTSTVLKIAETFKCKPIEGMLSHQLCQNEIDGEKTIIQNPNEAQRKEHDKVTFEVHEVYGVDVLISTGEGQGRDMDTRVSVYKRNLDQYMLKLKTSRAFFSEVQNKHGHMAFNLRDFEDEKRAKMGVNECISHKIVEPYTVLYEKPTEVVAQFKFTLLLMPSGSHKVTGLPFDPSQCESEHKIEDEEIQKLLLSSVNPNKKKKKPAGGKSGGSSGASGDSKKVELEAANGETNC